MIRRPHQCVHLGASFVTKTGGLTVSMLFPDAVPLAWQVLLEHAFVKCADAGFGRLEELPGGGKRFEAYPGQENAAADLIEALLIGSES